MNEQIEELVAKSGEKVLEWMDFAEGQAPVLVQEILQWGFWFYGSVTLVCLLGLCVTARAVLWGWRHANTLEGTDVEGCKGFSVAAGLGVSSLIMAAVVINGTLAIKAAFFPRLYLLEQIAGLLG